MTRIFLKGSRLTRFEALQNELVPLSKSFTPAELEESRRLINLVLADKPLLIHFKIALFLRLIDFVSLITGGHSFKKLRSGTRRHVLDFFFSNPFPLLRKGFWGINTLAKMGLYGQSSVYPKLNYRLKETPHD